MFKFRLYVADDTMNSAQATANLQALCKAHLPGRHEIDETQELYYPAIMRGIAATGFKGYVAQEFIPAKADKLKSLAEGVTICDI